jgi:hypothetical protein
LFRSVFIRVFISDIGVNQWLKFFFFPQPTDPSPHYTIQLENHQTRESLRLDLFDTPFQSRKYELRVNGSRYAKCSYATKTQIWDRLRKWMLAHN